MLFFLTPFYALGHSLRRGVYIVSTSAGNQSVRLTKRVVEQLAPPVSGQQFVRDTDLKGFALRITASGAKAFVVEKRINGKVALGIDPLAEKAEARLKTVTLGEAFADFLRARKTLKPRTRYDYERVMAVGLPDWQSRPLVLITKENVAHRHRELGETRGEAYANLVMRVLRAVLNFAKEKYERPDGSPLLSQNPVDHLTRGRGWYRVSRRRTVLKVHQLPTWHEAVQALRTGPGHEGAADYLLFLLYSGLRKQEALQLTWEDVDLKARTLFIADPKNREPLTLPLSAPLLDILARRAEARINHYVFPGRDGRAALVEPKRAVAKVVQRSGIEFTLHDLRRTFITIAEALDLSPYAIKRLVNHKLSGDVTAGYIVTDVERLREPMERIGRFIQSALTDDGRKVVVLPATGPRSGAAPA